MLDHVDEEVVVGPVIDRGADGEEQQAEPHVEEERAKTALAGSRSRRSPLQVGETELVNHQVAATTRRNGS